MGTLGQRRTSLVGRFLERGRTWAIPALWGGAGALLGGYAFGGAGWTVALGAAAFLTAWGIRAGTSRRAVLGESATDDEVRLGAAAPHGARPDAPMVIRAFAYAVAHADTLFETLRGVAPRSRVVREMKACRWQVGTEVQVHCSGPHLDVSEPLESFRWNGRYEIIAFDVRVKASAPRGPTPIQIDFFVADVRVARLRLDLDVGSDAPEDEQSTNLPAMASAFASYSSEDRDRVLDRIAALRLATGMDCFVDCLSIHPGERWKGRIAKEIDRRTGFLLFWSTHARASPWVEWEWQRCLSLRGVDAIQLHPLDSLEDAPPPEELDQLHFDDPMMRIRSSYAEGPASTPPSADEQAEETRNQMG